MPIIKKALVPAIQDTLKGVGDVLDTVITNEPERLEARKQIADIMLRHLLSLEEARSRAIEKEMEGSALQRNWRPVVMLSFSFIIMYHYFLQPLISFWTPVPSIELPSAFWTLVELGMGGYVIGRSMEKIADRIQLTGRRRET